MTRAALTSIGHESNWWGLAYRSCSDIGNDPVSLWELLENARVRNQRLDICGILIKDGTHFFHYLEGRRRQLAVAWRSIKSDPRHRDVRIHYRSPISARYFSDQPIAYLTAEELSTAVLTDIRFPPTQPSEFGGLIRNIYSFVPRVGH